MLKRPKGLDCRIGVVSLASPLEVGADRASQAAETCTDLLRRSGCEVICPGVVDTPDRAVSAGLALAEEHVHAVVFVPACWHEDYLVLDFLEECPVPVFLWPLPGMETGALCGTQQLTCFLKQVGHPFATAFGTLDNTDCLDRAMVFLRATALRARLRRARIGLAGSRIGGMTHTSPNEFMLKKSIGPRVVPLDLPQLLARAADMPAADAQDRWDSIVARAGECHVTAEEGLDSMRVYAALKELVEEHSLDALSIGCYPHLMGRVCLAASQLADEGVPLACEGDVHGAVGQYMMQLLTGQPTHNTDWLDPVDGESVVFTHCGSGSFALASCPDQIRLDSVRLMSQGVCALFPARTGPVTMININALSGGYQCALLEGEALPAEMVFPGNPVRVRFDTPVQELIEWIHGEGMGHHWMIGYGHVGAEIRTWAKLAGPDLRMLTV